MRVKIVFIAFITALFGQPLLAADAKLTTLCGFDFSVMEWKKFNNGLIVKRYGRGCGYNPRADVRKHVFYLDQQKIWLQFTIKSKENWVTAIRISQSPLCNNKIAPKTRLVCRTSEGVSVWDNKSKIARIYGKGNQEGNKITFSYGDIDVETEIILNGDLIAGIKVVSNLI